MKHPLKLKHRIAREMTCKIKGHKWVISKRQRRPDRLYLDDIESSEDYRAAMLNDISYLERKTSRNELWESLAWWDVKCVRCRWKKSGMSIFPWHKDRWYQVKRFVQDVGWTSKYYLMGTSGPLWKKVIAVPVIAVASGIEQSWASWNDIECGSFMWWPIEVAGEIHNKLLEWVEDTK